MLTLPIRNTRGLNVSTVGCLNNLQVSLRIVGLVNGATINIYGIPDDVFTSEQSLVPNAKNEPDSIDMELSIDCERVFLKAHKFPSAMPSISVIYVHTSRVADRGKTSTVLKSNKTIKSKLKPSKGRTSDYDQ